jgi:transcriptional regulator with XRE-family HTH domain
MMTFGEFLRSERRARGISQETLADRAGMHRTSVSLIERDGRRDPRLDTLVSLARALGIPPAEMVDCYAQRAGLL